MIQRYTKYTAIALLLFPLLSSSQIFPVCFSFNKYEGEYFVDNYNPIFTAGKDTVFMLPAGFHTIGVNGYVFAEESFNIDASGRVYGLTNTVAATLAVSNEQGRLCHV